MSQSVPRSKFDIDRRSLLAGAAALSIAGPGTAFAQDKTKLKAINPTRSTSSWTMWIAKESGYYDKYGLDVTPQFGVHPVGIAGLISGDVQFTNYSLDDVAAATMRDPVLMMVGSLLHKGSFALMARPEFKKVEDLKGKRFGVGRVGDPPYHYTVGLIKDYGLKSSDVQWVPTGTDASARVTMLVTGQIDAALITPPSWYKVEAQGMKPLTLLEDHENMVLTVGNVYKRSWVAEHPDVPERVLRAQGEAVHRFYTDKAAAIAAYRKYDPSVSQSDVERVYDNAVRVDIIDRIPLLQKAAGEAVVDRIGGDIPALKQFDFTKVIDNKPVRKLIDEGFFEKLYGPGIKAEQDRRLKGAYA
jgi:ABC-type nitrate/sulfonate/bicarbonate transport system substrate-binding protein